MTVLSLPGGTRARVATRQRIHPATQASLARMTRYRGGTYSHTVDTIVFSDGTSARTDLIRLNPDVQAYSLDFTAAAPVRPARYRAATWSALAHPRVAACEAEVAWILRHSFPVLSTAELSRALRAAGYPLGRANIGEHEAIAGTQAAIWYLTNGLALDNRPLNVPVAVRRAPGPVITLEFDGEPQLGGYLVRVRADAPATFALQKSPDGHNWQDISRSGLSVAAGGGWHQRTLGVGSTLAASYFGRAGRGYRFYRLVAATNGRSLRVDDVRFWLSGSGHYRNPERVVHLYNYLLAAARQARRISVEPRLVAADAVHDTGLVGPLRVTAPLALAVPDGHALVDADGFALRGVIDPDTEFYLRPAPGASVATLTAATPGDTHAFLGRVLTAMALGGPGLTPVALTVAADVAVDFEIRWDADEDPHSTPHTPVRWST
jgi:TQXA domain-containing protein